MKILATEMKPRMLLKGGGWVFLTLGKWRKARKGTPAALNGWQGKVIPIIVLAPTRYGAYTTDLWILPEHEKRSVEVLWHPDE